MYLPGLPSFPFYLSSYKNPLDIAMQTELILMLLRNTEVIVIWLHSAKQDPSSGVEGRGFNGASISQPSLPLAQFFLYEGFNYK
jgi:hypothetical protein